MNLFTYPSIIEFATFYEIFRIDKQDSPMPIKDIATELLLLLVVAIGAAFLANFFSPRGLAFLGEWDTSKGVISAKARDAAVRRDIEINDVHLGKKIYDEGKTVFVDARAPDRYIAGHIKGAVLLPARQREDFLEEFITRYDPSTPIVTYCSGRECDDSHELARFLAEMGYTDVRVMVDGYPGWEKEGYPIDARGRRVPLNVVKGEVKQRTKQKRKRTRERKKPRVKRRPVVETIGVGDIVWSTREYHLNSDLTKGEPENIHFKNFSNVNKQSLETISGQSNVAEVFNAALEGHLAQGPFERDEMTLYDYGLHLRPASGTFDQKVLDMISERLAGTGATITRIQEGPGHDSVLIGIGDNRNAVSADTVEATLEGATGVLSAIYEDLYNYFGDDIYWDVWWDTDEEMY